MKRLAWFVMMIALLLLTACGAREEAAVPEEPVSEIETDSEEAVHNKEDIDETEDHVLLTLEAPLGDGRTLTLEAFGKRLDEYNYGVREVRVYDGEDLLQTVPVMEALEDVWGSAADDGMEYTNCWTPEKTMEVLDLNLDGNMDFGLFGWPANNTIPYYYWTWDKAAGEYRYAYTMQGVEVHPAAGEIVSSYKSGSAGSEYVYEYYRPDGDGDLVLDRTEKAIYSQIVENQEMQDPERPAWETWVPREGVTVRPWVHYTADLVLVRREIPVYELSEDNTATYFTEIWELGEDGELELTSREEFSYET